MVIKFDGKVKVNWSEGVTRKEGRARKYVTVFYNADESYFNQEILLSKKNVMAKGRSTFEFEYTLPSDLPSSFLSRFGNVSYSITATMGLPSSRSDAVCIVPFTVNGILDLNVEPGTNLEYETRKYKSICCLCCTSGPVGFIFRMTRRGFVPGESIEFTVELNNQSGQQIYGMKVSLMQECNFHASGNSKKTLRPIRQVQGPQVGPGESEIWIEKMLRIPPVPPSRLATCRLIDVQYFLKVRYQMLKYPKCSSIMRGLIIILSVLILIYPVQLQLEMALPNMTLNLKDEIPITIGTIPLRNTFANLNGSMITLPLSNGEQSLETASKASLLSLSIEDVMEEPTQEFTSGTQIKLQKLPVRTRGFSVSSDHPSFSEYPDLRKFIFCIPIYLQRKLLFFN